MRRIVIVGGGPAAHRCAFALRARGYDGRLVMLCGEPTPPYDRTLVSKDLLAERPPPLGDSLLEPEEAYAAHGVDLRLGEIAVELDWRGRRVRLAGGREERYDRLVIATGATPCRPASLADPAVMTLRTREDAARLAGALETGARLAVVGGGFIGGEVASVARERALEVSVLEALDAPLAQALGPQVGERVAALHRACGVQMLTGARVEALRRAGAAFELRLADGRRVVADAVLAGTGVRPATDWLADAPILHDGAVVTDARCRTALPGVLAAGDVAAWFDSRWGAHVRVEHWDTARRHGDAVAASALGGGKPFEPLPFFWSDQHDVKLQLVGSPRGFDHVEVVDEDPPRAYVARYYAGGALVAVLAANRPRAVAQGRRELLAGVKTPAVIA